MAQQEGERLFERFPYLDLVLGTQGFYRIREALEELIKTGKPVAYILGIKERILRFP